MNVSRQLASFRYRGVWLLAAPLSLLALPDKTCARSREAVQKAIAATVAVEWRAHVKADQPPPEQKAGSLRLPEAGAPAGEADTKQVAGRTRWRRMTAIVARRADLTLASGVVVSANGLVVTLNQEPDGNAEGRYDVVFADGRSLPARVVVDDHRSGLRLLKVDGADLAHLTPADTGAEIGDQVFAAFSTDRHERSAAQGMLAARQKTGTLELDLSAGPMSAGGPLVNEQGGLVGILAGGSAPEAAGRPSHSAIPLRDVRALLADQQGENTVVVHRGFLGVSLDSKPVAGGEQVVVHLLADSPARAAGMLDGDVLVAVADEKITSTPQAAAVVARHSPGEKIPVRVSRDGQEITLEITAGRPPAALEAVQNAGQTRSGGAAARLRASLVRPDQVWVMSEDGKPVAVPVDQPQVEALRNYFRYQAAAEKPYGTPEPTASTIRVERSDLDKKLEDVGRHVESLQEQVKKLTEEIQALRSKLAEGK